MISVPIVNVAVGADEYVVFNLRLKNESGVALETEFTIIISKLRALVVDRSGNGLSNSLVLN